MSESGRVDTFKCPNCGEPIKALLTCPGSKTDVPNAPRRTECITPGANDGLVALGRRGTEPSLRRPHTTTHTPLSVQPVATSVPKESLLTDRRLIILMVACAIAILVVTFVLLH